MYYELDKTTIGYYIYENFINYIIKNNKESDKTKLNCISQIYTNFSMAING